MVKNSWNVKNKEENIPGGIEKRVENARKLKTKKKQKSLWAWKKLKTHKKLKQKKKKSPWSWKRKVENAWKVKKKKERVKKKKALEKRSIEADFNLGMRVCCTYTCDLYGHSLCWQRVSLQ